MNFNSPVARTVAATQLCGELAINLVPGTMFKLVNPDSDNYQVVVDWSYAYVCPDSTEIVGDLESNENLVQRAIHALSLRSLIETLNSPTTGYPTSDQLSSATSVLDAALPDVETSDVYTYVVLPQDCGLAEQCTSYALNIAQ